MQKLISLLLILSLSWSSISAQVKNVIYDAKKNTFDNDYALPSEERFTITGYIDTTVQLVEIEIYEGVNKKGIHKEYYSTNWARDISDNGNQFYLSIKKPLRQNEKYSFDIRLFRLINSEEADYTQKSLVSSIQNYLNATTRNTGKELELTLAPSEIQKEINSIITDGLKNYRTRNQENFIGFSDIINKQLADLGDVTGSRAKNIKKEESQSLEGTLSNKIDALVQQANIEIEQYFNQEIFVQFDTKTVTDHPTERQKNIVAINAGYGGAWFDGNLNNFNYGHAPYVGLSFPLGKKSFSSKFWSNTSISAGVFLLNFKDNDGTTIKGPIIQRPFYAALGYKFFRFLRFNAGAVVLERKEDDGSGFINADKIFVRPFVGLSLELNFWADFAK